MFGIGGPELILILVVLFIFVGPDKLPGVARTVGTGLRDLKRAANLASAELKQGMDELQREVAEVQRDVSAAASEWERDVPPSQPLAEVPRRRDAAAPSGGPAPAEAAASPSGAAAEDSPPAVEVRDEVRPASPPFNRPGSVALTGTVARGGAAAVVAPAVPVTEPALPVDSAAAAAGES